jgi:hypothetical protein
MVVLCCHESGKGIICMDNENSSSACSKSSKTCGFAKCADIMYKFRSEEISDGSGIYIPSNAVGISTHENGVSWLEPIKG